VDEQNMTSRIEKTATAEAMTVFYIIKQ